MPPELQRGHATAGQRNDTAWPPDSEAAEDHVAEDERTLAAVLRLRYLYGRDWQATVPSLAARLYDHVALGDCPLGRRQCGAAAYLIEPKP